MVKRSHSFHGCGLLNAFGKGSQGTVIFLRKPDEYDRKSSWAVGLLQLERETTSVTR